MFVWIYVQTDRLGWLWAWMASSLQCCVVLLDGQTDRQADRQTGRQADRQAGRQIRCAFEGGGGVYQRSRWDTIGRIDTRNTQKPEREREVDWTHRRRQTDRQESQLTTVRRR